MERTQGAVGGSGGRGLQGAVAPKGLVDVDSVWRQGSSQCGQTTSHQLSTPNQLRAVDLGDKYPSVRHHY